MRKADYVLTLLVLPFAGVVAYWSVARNAANATYIVILLMAFGWCVWRERRPVVLLALFGLLVVAGVAMWIASVVFVFVVYCDGGGCIS